MFILHSSNKTENLLAHVQAVLNAAPLDSVFAAEVFLIQSQGMERWLSQQLALQQQVCANFRFLFPVNFLNTLSERLLGGETDRAFDRSLLLWRLEDLLRDSGGEPDYLPLQGFLSGGDVDLKRYQLARQLAQLFDQYQIQRPELLEAWLQGKQLHQAPAEIWQGRLWRALVERLGPRHRGEQWRAAAEWLRQNPPGAFAAVLPERISVFGVNSMPPLLLVYLNALALHCDVHLYLLNPSREYWAELPGKRQASLEADAPTAHPLLSKLAWLGRDFQQLLLEQSAFDLEPCSFEEHAGLTNLSQLQNAILRNDPGVCPLVADGSISVHSCHSRLREAQVLKNLLLDALQGNPDLQWRDIVVMAPDMQAYAPFISAVFADIPHAVADRGLAGQDECLQIVSQFLALLPSRFGWQSVLDLLEQPLVAANFELGESDLALIRHWVAETNIRWGLSAAHRQALDLPALDANTWEAGLARLFTGYASGDGETFIGGVLPYAELEGSASAALGGLYAFLQTLFAAAADRDSRKSLAEWRVWLEAYAQDLIGAAEPQIWQPLRDILAQWAEIGELHRHPLSLSVIRQWLAQQVEETRSSQGFLRGQLTFCSMLPMRSIPFAVIALLGMNDGEFPHAARAASFDLLSAYPRPGDRSRRNDDRYQFLEILLSARRQLIITYVGRSQRDNKPLPPSIVVGELLDVLKRQHALNNLVVEHPLQPFSPRYFDGENPKLFSYSGADAELAAALRQPPPPGADWAGEIAVEPPEALNINDMLSFFRHPQRYFLRLCGIHLPRFELSAEEREPFQPDSLTLYAVRQQAVAELLAGQAPDLTKLQAGGLWPSAAAGELQWRGEREPLDKFVQRIAACGVGEPLPPCAVDLRIGGNRVQGALNGLHERGGLHYRYGNMKGGEFFCAWLQHLLLNRLRPAATYLLSRDRELTFTPEMAGEERLEQLIAIYLQGRRRPDAFCGEAVFTWLQCAGRPQALDKVIEKIGGDMQNGYEPEWNYLWAHRPLERLFAAEFEAQCRDVFLPIWSSLHAGAV